jgi:hypothetical protein
MWPFKKKPQLKTAKCPQHGAVYGVNFKFEDYTINPLLCEVCIATMFVKNCQVVERLNGK